MADRTITLIKSIAFRSNLLDEAAARDEKDQAIEDVQDAIDETHAHRVKKAEEDAQAIRDEFNGRFLGAAIGNLIIPGAGWLIGWPIGWGIGNANGNKHEERAYAAEEAAGLSDLVREEASDDMMDANEEIADAETRNDQLDAFIDEVRQFERHMAEDG